MRTYRTNRGPFATRPHYKLAEIDRICGDALNTAGLMPESPEAVRIDRFVEKHFKVSPRYEPLPEGVLGYTSFGPAGVTGIVITTALDEEGGSVSERRIRTTLAHEAGHGLLHTHLFALGSASRRRIPTASGRQLYAALGRGSTIVIAVSPAEGDGAFITFGSMANRVGAVQLIVDDLASEPRPPDCEPCGEAHDAICQARLALNKPRGNC